ncbi:MAG: molybdopterin-dependent oxidoreductase [candidate division Zixibacteria bacterium]|nr:molybdopterin-dependent oxidoreductase [candidate division Zixibacteria bacterium]
MTKKDAKLTITINNKPYRVAADLTILKAAEENGIYIPTLCAHKELTPHGGCRLCIVEVEGFRNFPTACTTPVSDGMIIRTDTSALNAVRTEILQLFMSEHTSSCLICPETEECRAFMGTVRKAGVTTGCRYCPNDGQCELQDVVEKLDIKEIKYPIYYRNNRVEKEDPFFDRDYNLCVLCGRCVRMCQEIRTANVLAFNYRGRETVIGPAYGRTHVEAGCEFCGACVSVCPTGALSEKDRKWEGKPDREEVTTCSFCGVGCQMRLQVKENRIIGSLPVLDDPVNNGQLCVRGRFCISEVVNGHQRLLAPQKNAGDVGIDISWDNAIAGVAEILAECGPDEAGILISPNCTNEDLYVAQKFVRVALGSHNIDTSARTFYGSGFNAYLNLVQKATPLSEVAKASVVLCVGLESRFGRSVVGVEIRRAMNNGAKILSIHPRQHNLSLLADKWVQPLPGDEVATLQKLVKLSAKKTDAKKKTGTEDDLAMIARLLKEAKSSVVLVGSEFLQFDSSARILTLIDELAGNVGAGILPLPVQNNLIGSLMMGAYPELLPGAMASNNAKRAGELKKTWGVKLPAYKPSKQGGALFGGKKLKVLYLIGENAPNGDAPAADFVISQNLYAAEASRKVDLDLPAAAFTEADGTFFNGEGRVQRVRKAVEPKGQALPDWQILCRIAKKMGVSGFDYKSAADIHKEMSTVVPGLRTFERPARKPQTITVKSEMVVSGGKKSAAKKADKSYPFMLSACAVEHVYRGMALSTWVDGSRAIFREGVVEVNSDDARRAKLSDGDHVTVTAADFKKVWPIRIAKEQAPGTLFVVLPQGESLKANPQPVKIRKKNV